MAADDPTRRPLVSSSLGPWLVLALALVTGYAAWQLAPLGERMDALERKDLAMRDRLLAEIERLSFELAVLRGAPVGREPAGGPATVPRATPAQPEASASTALSPVPARPPAPEPKQAAADLEAYVDAHLLPADAAIVHAMLKGAPLADIARQTQHSQAFVLARGAQIERVVSAAPGAPRELVRALQEYLRHHRP